MFKTFFFLELKSALKQPMIYIFLGLLTLLTFAATSSPNVSIGGSLGSSVYANAPYIITRYTAIMSIFGLLMAVAFFNNAALRDHNNNFNEILFSTRLNKSGYFFGRFFGALVLATIPLLGIFIGVVLASMIAPPMNWLAADRFGDFYFMAFVNNYLLFILPNMFFAGAIIFAMASKWKSTVISFVGALIIIVGYIAAGSLISDLDSQTLAALTDIFGIRTYGIISKYYTPAEKNTLITGFSGLLLYNRLIWISVGSLILGATYATFSFKEKNKKVKAQKAEETDNKPIFSLPKLNPTHTQRTEWLQFKSFFYTNFISIAKSVTFKIMLLFSLIILATDLIGGFEYYGLQSYPITYKIIDIINDASTIFIVIILVFFSGELVWRDRENKINEVIDATSHTSFISLIAKALSLVSITSLLYFFFVFCGIIYQLANGYTRIELGVYFTDFFFTSFPNYIVWSGVMIMIQVLTNNKYIGYFISIAITFAWSIIMRMLDIESNMLLLGEGASMQYSDMNSFGPGFLSAMWFNAYWILFSVLSLLIAGALWNRGTMSSLKSRISIANKQTPKKYKIVILATGLIWIAVASFVYYNTQVLNEYQTSDVQEEWRAAYEKKYKKYENINKPKITDAKYFVDIFPYKRDMNAKVILQLENQSNTMIEELHFNLDNVWDIKLTIPNAKLDYEDEEFYYVIYKLTKPLQAGETIEIEIQSDFITKGFQNGRGYTKVINNGTFVNNFDVLPFMGYNVSLELNDKTTRAKYDLPEKERMPELSQDSTKRMGNYLTGGTSDYINIETVISTAGDQTAIAPGSLVKKWTKDGRNYYKYKLDNPSQHFMSFVSAKYEIATKKWNGIDIEVYYDKKHGTNIDMMLDAVERSLKYYSKNFGEYRHKQCRIIEFPRYATFAQAFPGTMPYSESFGFVINLEDAEGNNVIDAVISHEMAHQWWAHQVVGADMQGGTMLSESFAEYSSLMVMKSTSKTPMKMREFLKYDHDRYLRGRSREAKKELPLYKVENQGYIHYGKGSAILYALQDYIGEEKINRVLRNFLNEFKYKAPPYPTSLDFLKYLEPEVPDSLQYLITDWFKEITLYDNRLEEATYKKLTNGKFEVTMKVESHKIKADSLGNETKTAMNDWVDIGVFSDKDEESLLFEKRVKIIQPEMTFTFEVNSKPLRAAIDPRRLLIDRVYKDNTKALKEED
jgi:hypothetical protein